VNRRALVLPCLWAAALVAPAAAQGFHAQIGRFYPDGGWTLYRVGMSRPLAGVLGLEVHGDYLSRVGGGDGAFAGLGADLSVFRGGGEGPYLVAGLGGGLGSPHSRGFSSAWGSWSAGVGYELFPVSFLGVGAEGRWRHLSLDARRGFELAAGVSIRAGGRGRRPAPATPAEPPRASGPATADPNPALATVVPVSADTAAPVASIVDSVVASAVEAVGRPYRLGGAGAEGAGFDCSGLIQYAYGRHGVALPRRSVDQAAEGREVGKRLSVLRPGDLLTFSNQGGRVTHVGLYLGGGLFIHSATRGVQVSTLSADDPYGRWWFRRWVGARRIVGD